MDFTEAISRNSRTRRIRLLQVGILTVLVTWLYAPIASGLVIECWRNPNYTYGLVVPVFSLCVLWQDRAKLAKLPLKPSWSGLVMLLLAVLALVIGTISSEYFLPRLSFLFLICGIVVFFAGWEHLFAVSFPLGFLILMAPSASIVHYITLPLQLIASNAGGFLLKLAGIPVIREGNILLVPRARLQVAEACSGIQSLFSLLTLAIIYGYVVEKRIRIRVLLAVSAVPIAIATNGLRIALAAIALQFLGLERTEGFFHVFSGWLVFMGSLLMLFLFHRILAISWATAHVSKVEISRA
jgi:exosortase